RPGLGLGLGPRLLDCLRRQRRLGLGRRRNLGFILLGLDGLLTALAEGRALRGLVLGHFGLGVGLLLDGLRRAEPSLTPEGPASLLVPPAPHSPSASKRRSWWWSRWPSLSRFAARYRRFSRFGGTSIGTCSTT